MLNSTESHQHYQNIGSITTLNVESTKYYIAAQIMAALDYSSPKQTLLVHLTGERKYLKTSYAKKAVRVISESELKYLLSRLKKKRAKELEKYLFD